MRQALVNAQPADDSAAIGRIVAFGIAAGLDPELCASFGTALRGMGERVAGNVAARLAAETDAQVVREILTAEIMTDPAMLQLDHMLKPQPGEI